MRRLTLSFFFTRKLIRERCMRPTLRSASAVDVPRPGSCRKPFASRSRSLFSLFVIILIINAPLSARAEETPEIELTPEEKAWLDARSVLRVEGGILPPLDGIQHGGEVSGMACAYSDLIADKLGILFEHTTGVWAEVHERAKRREEK